MAIPIKEEAKGIYRLGPLATGHDSGPTSPFLVVGSERMLIAEPGQDGQAPQIVQAIKQLGLDPNRVAYIWASHVHFYHIQGVPVLLNLLPNAKFLAHPIAAPHVVDVTRLTEQTQLVWVLETPQDVAAGVKQCFGPMAPMPADRVMAVKDRQVFDLGGRQVEVIYSPGHASHHTGLFDHETKVLFPGDLDTGQASFPKPGQTKVIIFDTDKFVDSIRRYRSLNPSKLLTFGQPTFAEAEKVLWEVEWDMIAVERICLVGMKEKLSLAEIDRRVEDYKAWVKSERFGTQGMRPGLLRGAPVHMMSNLIRKYPALELPKNIEAKVGPRRGIQGMVDQGWGVRGQA